MGVAEIVLPTAAGDIPEVLRITSFSVTATRLPKVRHVGMEAMIKSKIVIQASDVGARHHIFLPFTSSE